MQDTFINFLDELAKRSGRTAICEAAKAGYMACCEAHLDRTTGGNYFGKTVRDQNNYDRHHHDTKTSDETNRRYGFTKSGVKAMGLAGKYGERLYDLQDDGFCDTGDNSGISPVGRRIMKRKFDRAFSPSADWLLDAENPFVDENSDEFKNEYEPMTKTQLKGVDPTVFSV